MKTYHYVTSARATMLLDAKAFPIDMLRDMERIDECGIVVDGKRVMWTAPDDTSYIHRVIEKRGLVAEAIEAHRVDDKVWIITGGRDHVDLCSWTNAPSLVSIQNAMDTLTRNNEDIECSYWGRVISAEEAADCQPEHRDHIMEAYEDGHPYSVSWS
jgi:hypothetical protein